MFKELENISPNLKNILLNMLEIEINKRKNIAYIKE